MSKVTHSWDECGTSEYSQRREALFHPGRQGGALTSVYLVSVCVCVEWICVVRLQVYQAAVDCVHVPIFLTMPVHTEGL